MNSYGGLLGPSLTEETRIHKILPVREAPRSAFILLPGLDPWITCYDMLQILRGKAWLTVRDGVGCFREPNQRTLSAFSDLLK